MSIYYNVYTNIENAIYGIHLTGENFYFMFSRLCIEYGIEMLCECFHLNYAFHVLNSHAFNFPGNDYTRLSHWGCLGSFSANC